MSVKIEVWGDYASFNRPEMKVERVSYDVMTPSAARGILEAIYWHPGLRWQIDRIYVRAPIRFTNIRRNEVKDSLIPERRAQLWSRAEASCILQRPRAYSSVLRWCFGMSDMSLKRILT